MKVFCQRSAIFLTLRLDNVTPLTNRFYRFYRCDTIVDTKMAFTTHWISNVNFEQSEQLRIDTLNNE